MNVLQNAGGSAGRGTGENCLRQRHKSETHAFQPTRASNRTAPFTDKLFISRYSHKNKLQNIFVFRLFLCILRAWMN